MRYVKDFWLGISLKKKLGIYAGVVILIVGLSAMFSFFLMDFSLGSFNVILDDNGVCYDFQEAMELEAAAFEKYTRDRTEENRQAYENACDQTAKNLERLPYDYEVVGQARYAKTWSIRNSYENYCQFRDTVLDMNQEDQGYISSLYQVYSMQEYLQTYARQLLQLTMETGNASYQQQVPIFYRLPYLIMLLAAVLIAIVMAVTVLVSRAVVSPMEKLADATRKIAVNDFSGGDLTVENRDEMGEMVRAFNKMKHATEGYIQTLKQNYEMAELLHKEEMQKVEIEKNLQATRLELLKSQINPHFLFNTLNIIACMAKLEDADTTERMITSMSNLFRYNLKTSEQIVPLRQELSVVQDYMYIQKMRFGERIRYDLDCQVDDMTAMVPAFTLQPLVENAIVHGLAKKEQGGRIFLRVWEKDNMLTISIGDTGIGMDEGTRQALLKDLESHQTARIGIGLGNIYQRIHTMYPDGGVGVYSRVNCGTVIQLRIPQEKPEGL